MQGRGSVQGGGVHALTWTQGSAAPAQPARGTGTRGACARGPALCWGEQSAGHRGTGAGGGRGIGGTWQCVSSVRVHHKPMPLALPAPRRGEDLPSSCLDIVAHTERVARGLGGGNRSAELGPCNPRCPPPRTAPTWKTQRAQVRKASSCAHSSSPSPMARMRSPPSSSSRVSTARAKAQKCG